ncbi:MAG: S1 RNA-binding domain-containing protein [Spirochaetes bacterium]|nr:S1 RNA-binding domain-containing protein [Spirochaetota bacterium]
MIENEHATEESLENFEEMLEQSLKRSDGAEIGEEVTGRVISVTPDTAFVDIAGKTDALLNILEFTDDDGTVRLSQGDTVKGYIVNARGGEVFITEKIGLGYFSPETLAMAYRKKLPIYGRVIDTTKGGYIVSLPGIHCFCPMSQIDLKMPSRPDEYLEKTLQFLVTEYSGKGKRAILSRRTLLEAVRDRREAELKDSLNVGDTIRGTVQSVQSFGIFVDIGGFQALLPKSEASWSRHADLSSFTSGTEIEASVKAIDWENRKVTLSLKDMVPEPWTHAKNLVVGQELSGRIVNTIKNGAFVELMPGLEGFIHISNLSALKNVKSPEEVVSRNDEVTVRILAIRNGEKKISLALVTGEPDPWSTEEGELLNTIHTAVVESVKPAGLGARLENGMLGFIPKDELRSRKSAETIQEYQVGSTVKVTIKRLDPQGKKMILTEEGAVRRAEKEEYEKFMKGESTSCTSSLGSLLKDKFEKIKQDMGG